MYRIYRKLFSLPGWKQEKNHNTLISDKMLVVWGKNQLGIKLREPAYLFQKSILGERVFNINNLLLLYE